MPPKKVVVRPKAKVGSGGKGGPPPGAVGKGKGKGKMAAGKGKGKGPPPSGAMFNAPPASAFGNVLSAAQHALQSAQQSSVTMLGQQSRAQQSAAPFGSAKASMMGPEGEAVSQSVKPGSSGGQPKTSYGQGMGDTTFEAASEKSGASDAENREKKKKEQEDDEDVDKENNLSASRRPDPFSKPKKQYKRPKHPNTGPSLPEEMDGKSRKLRLSGKDAPRQHPVFKLISDLEQLDEFFDGMDVHDKSEKGDFMRNLMKDKNVKFWRKAQMLRVGGNLNVLYNDYEKRARIRQLAKEERQQHLVEERQKELESAARSIREIARRGLDPNLFPDADHPDARLVMEHRKREREARQKVETDFEKVVKKNAEKLWFIGQNYTNVGRKAAPLDRRFNRKPGWSAELPTDFETLMTVEFEPPDDEYNGYDDPTVLSEPDSDSDASAESISGEIKSPWDSRVRHPRYLFPRDNAVRFTEPLRPTTWEHYVQWVWAKQKERILNQWDEDHGVGGPPAAGRTPFQPGMRRMPAAAGFVSAEGGAAPGEGGQGQGATSPFQLGSRATSKRQTDQLDVPGPEDVWKQAQELYVYVTEQKDDQDVTDGLHGLLAYKLDKMGKAQLALNKQITNKDLGRSYNAAMGLPAPPDPPPKPKDEEDQDETASLGLGAYAKGVVDDIKKAKEYAIPLITDPEELAIYRAQVYGEEFPEWVAEAREQRKKEAEARAEEIKRLAWEEKAIQYKGRELSEAEKKAKQSGRSPLFQKKSVVEQQQVAQGKKYTQDELHDDIFAGLLGDDLPMSGSVAPKKGSGPSDFDPSAQVGDVARRGVRIGGSEDDHKGKKSGGANKSMAMKSHAGGGAAMKSHGGAAMKSHGGAAMKSHGGAAMKSHAGGGAAMSSMAPSAMKSHAGGGGGAMKSMGPAAMKSHAGGGAAMSSMAPSAMKSHAGGGGGAAMSSMAPSAMKSNAAAMSSMAPSAMKSNAAAMSSMAPSAMKSNAAAMSSMAPSAMKSNAAAMSSMAPSAMKSNAAAMSSMAPSAMKSNAVAMSSMAPSAARGEAMSSMAPSKQGGNAMSSMAPSAMKSNAAAMSSMAPSKQGGNAMSSMAPSAMKSMGPSGGGGGAMSSMAPSAMKSMGPAGAAMKSMGPTGAAIQSPR